MSLIAGRGCRWPRVGTACPRAHRCRGGRDTHDGHENSPILVFFSNLLGVASGLELHPVDPGPGHADHVDWRADMLGVLRDLSGDQLVS